jgi:hypothetical protein
MTRFLKSVVPLVAAALACWAFTPSAAASRPLLSYYAFNSTAHDELGNSPDIYLNRTTFTNNTLYLSAAPYSYTAYATIPNRPDDHWQPKLYHRRSNFRPALLPPQEKVIFTGLHFTLRNNLTSGANGIFMEKEKLEAVITNRKYPPYND